MGIFDELKNLGFKNIDQFEVYSAPQGQGKKEEAKHQVTVEELLYDKSYSCPVCGNDFKSKSIRSGRNRLMSVELDLKPIYEIVNPLLYEPIICEKCGYGGLAKNFAVLSNVQIGWIKAQICSRYKSYHFPEVLTPKEAIHKYKIVLLNYIVKKARDGEKAYLCLKMAWVYRDLKNEEQEMIFLKYALTGFLNAYNKERFPIFELDELTVAYIIAELYRRFKEYDKALQWIGYIVLDRSVSLRLKAKALHLKSVIKEEKEKELMKQ